MTGLERNGDIVSMASYAPLFAKNNFTQWRTDMIFFDNQRYYLTPNYHVQKLFSLNTGSYYIDKVITKDQSDSLLSASCVYDDRSGDLILKLVNAGKSSKHFKVDLSSFEKYLPDAARTVFSGDSDAANSFEHPKLVQPVDDNYQVTKKFEYETLPVSLTVIRIKTR